jgi:hypothetical protein
VSTTEYRSRRNVRADSVARGSDSTKHGCTTTMVAMHRRDDSARATMVTMIDSSASAISYLLEIEDATCLSS